MCSTITNLELPHEAFVETHAKHVQEVGLALCHTGKLQCAYRLAGFNFFQRCTRPVHAIVLWIACTISSSSSISVEMYRSAPRGSHS